MAIYKSSLMNKKKKMNQKQDKQTLRMIVFSERLLPLHQQLQSTLKVRFYNCSARPYTILAEFRTKELLITILVSLSLA